MKRVAAVIVIIGLVLIGIGIYQLLRKSAPPATTEKKSPTPSGPTSVYVGAAEDYVVAMHVQKGQRISLSAKGSANASDSPYDLANRQVGPDGWGYDPTFNTGRKGPLPAGQSFMALAYRITDGSIPDINDGQWKLAGSHTDIVVPIDGVLYLTTNDKGIDASGYEHTDWRTNNTGGFDVTLKPEASQAASKDPNDLSDTYGMTVGTKTVFNKKTKVVFETPEQFFMDSGRSNFNYKFDMVQTLPPGLHFVDGRPVTAEEYRKGNGQ